MITFLIPIIHHKHQGISNYDKILDCLKSTIFNLLAIKVETNVVVLCHKKPSWEKEFYGKVIFIQLNSTLFNLLRILDYCKDNQKKQILENQKFKRYQNYLELGGKYHNKDKGLKYFIGLIYLFYLPPKKKPKWVALIDGDDFIHSDIGDILDKQPARYNEFFINKGYLFYQENGGNYLIKIDKFSSICGSNRFFRYEYLAHKIHNIFNIKFTPFAKNNLVYHKKVTDKLIGEIITYINTNVKDRSNLNIIPMFLGVHQLLFNGSILSNSFHGYFNIKYLDEYVAIKLFHNNNHSQGSKINNLISRYIKKKIISKKDYRVTDQVKVFQEFGIKH